ncbi:hypothetical protein ACI8B_520008 [Acinetobacter proteolyticus]|uniref:Uncharacterized protein n=1 Tax=Acinetobacter proteolyticus TaxID=1776741 RepID=A0A653KBG1_9GAMM|nr:hypothetical protein ACI8B_520008 [Acinetobacter proteolyticus]
MIRIEKLNLLFSMKMFYNSALMLVEDCINTYNDTVSMKNWIV